MTWKELATEHLRAARDLAADHPRASVTRSYYASVTAELYRRGIVNFGRFNNPPHNNIGGFVHGNLGLTTTDATNIVSLIAPLRYLREDADYRPAASVTSVQAADAVRDAEQILSAFGIPLY